MTALPLKANPITREPKPPERKSRRPATPASVNGPKKATVVGRENEYTTAESANKRSAITSRLLKDIRSLVAFWTANAVQFDHHQVGVAIGMALDRQAIGTRTFVKGGATITYSVGLSSENLRRAAARCGLIFHSNELESLIRAVGEHATDHMARAIGQVLSLSVADIEGAKLSHLWAIDETESERKARQVASRRLRDRDRKRNSRNGSRPHEQSVERNKPWISAGCSRRTYYRRLAKAGTEMSPVIYMETARTNQCHEVEPSPRPTAMSSPLARPPALRFGLAPVALGPDRSSRGLALRGCEPSSGPPRHGTCGIKGGRGT